MQTKITKTIRVSIDVKQHLDEMKGGFHVILQAGGWCRPRRPKGPAQSHCFDKIAVPLDSTDRPAGKNVRVHSS